MRCYVFKDHQVTVHPNAPTDIGDALLIARVDELDPKRFPVSRLIQIHNALPGVTPIKRLADRTKTLKAVWKALEELPLGIARAESKMAAVTRLLKRPEGCDMKGLIEATGWQPHSIRGLMSGALRKKQGLVVECVKAGGRSVYRINA